MAERENYREVNVGDPRYGVRLFAKHRQPRTAGETLDTTKESGMNKEKKAEQIKRIARRINQIASRVERINAHFEALTLPTLGEISKDQRASLQQ